MIYKQVTNIIIDTLKRMKGVNYVRYKGDDFINQQQNYKTLQAYVDDVSFHQFLVTKDIAKVEYNIYILGFAENDTEENVLDIQDQCYDVALYLLAYLDRNDDFKGIVNLYDYSILTLNHFSEQSNCGVKLSVVLEIPSGVCNVENMINDEPYEEEQDKEIDVDDDEVGDITITPTKLQPNRRC